jgi:hypothetical protein
VIAAAAMGEGAPWTLAGYDELLVHLRRSGVRTLDLREFNAGTEGVWLRHDVELDLAAAVDMARIEAARGVGAWYFLCVDSPFIDNDETALRRWIQQIEGLGHVVSLHMSVGLGLDPIETRTQIVAAALGIDEPTALTFHAPGLDSQVLSRVPGGEPVYGQLAANSCQYLSDSTGRWRWGSPWLTDFADRVTQLLIHPFWWGGKRSQLSDLCLDSAEHAAFLPRFRSEVLGV